MTRLDRTDDDEPICDEFEPQAMEQGQKTSPKIPNVISNEPGAKGQQPGYKAKNKRKLQYKATAH